MQYVFFPAQFVFLGLLVLFHKLKFDRGSKTKRVIFLVCGALWIICGLTEFILEITGVV